MVVVVYPLVCDADPSGCVGAGAARIGQVVAGVRAGDGAWDAALVPLVESSSMNEWEKHDGNQ